MGTCCSEPRKDNTAPKASDTGKVNKQVDAKNKKATPTIPAGFKEAVHKTINNTLGLGK